MKTLPAAFLPRHTASLPNSRHAAFLSPDQAAEFKSKDPDLLQSSTLILSTLLARLMAMPIDRTLLYRDILCNLQAFLEE